jgi:2-methylcitrate dehydratase PrpD
VGANRLLDQIRLLVPAQPLGEPDPRLSDLLVDALGVGVAGQTTSTAQAAAAVLGHSGTPWDLAWLQGIRIHALDFDDTHEPSLCHTAAAIVPGLLALAIERDLSGPEVLHALDFGLRVVAFLAPLGSRLNEMGVHSTGAVGSLGAAAACAWLLSRDDRVCLAAIDMAAVMAAGLAAAFGTDTKPVQAGRAAEVGVRAALFTEQGIGAPRDALFGRFGIFTLWLGEDAAQMAGWGSTHADASRQVALKPYPSCFLTHAVIDGVLAARRDLDLRDESAVTQVSLTVHPIAATIADKTTLVDSADAKFSLRYCVLAALRDGSPTVATFAEAQWRQACADQLAWTSWSDRFEVTREARMPQIGARIALMTQNGTHATHEVLAPRGSVGNPLASADIDAKFRANTAGALGPRGEDVLAELRSFTRLDRVRDARFVPDLLPPRALAAPA